MYPDDMEYGPFGMAEDNAKKAFELYSSGSMGQALEQIQTALDMNPYNSAWHFNKALTLDNIEKFEDAIGAYKQALELNPNDIDSLNCLAVDYTRTGQYDLAIKIFEEIQSIEPNFEPAYCNRIIAYTEMDKHALAEEMFYMAQQVEPNCPLCFYNIGNSLFITGQYDRAISCWKKTSQLEPAHPQINYRIAQAYWAKGESKSAYQYFLEELRIDPGSIEVLIDFGLFLLHNGEIYSAGEKFHRAAELDPDNATALFYSGEIAFNDGKFKEAAELYQLAIQKNDSMLGPRFRMAQCAMQCSDKESARKFLLAEFDLAPEDAAVQMAMGAMFAELAEFEYARWCFLRVIENDSAHTDAYHSLGVLCAMQNKFAEALEYFAHGLDTNAGHIDCLKDSAIVYWLADRLENALTRIDAAIAMEPDNECLKQYRRKIRFSQFAKKFTDSFGKLKKISKITVS